MTIIIIINGFVFILELIGGEAFGATPAGKDLRYFGAHGRLQIFKVQDILVFTKIILSSSCLSGIP